MMMLEKELAKTDIGKYKHGTDERFAIDICLYRNFKTKVALRKSESWKEKYSKITAQWYFDESVRYLRNGNSYLKKSFLALLDKHKDAVRPIEPRNDKERRIIKSTKACKVPVKRKRKVNNTVQKKYITRFLYGVRNKNQIITFDTEKEFNAFLSGVDFGNVWGVNSSQIDKIHIDLDSITSAVREEAK